ncbi:MAG TPA: RIP metalloprotease RseP [Chloroflexota bacterium]|nr:RIP metalloprotease RseP [Chloroflexota bacterium]
MDWLWIIPILLLLVFVHELGHFVTAKLAGITVREFGFGYPPRIFGITYKGTIYSLNLLPLGGFTRMEGEDGSEAAAMNPGSFASKPKRTRTVVLAAGSIMNAILAPLLLTAVFMIGMPTPTGRVFISGVQSDSPAAQAGLQAGDQVTDVQGHPIHSVQDFRDQVQFRLGQPTTIGIVRNGQASTLTLTPRENPPEGQGNVGVAIRDQLVNKQYPIWSAFAMGVQEAWHVFAAIWIGLFETIRGTIAPDFAGPVGIAQVTGEVAQLGPQALLEFAAFLSVNLAILNLLPIPALDGGRILFVVIEAIRGRRVDPRKEGVVHFIGMVILLTFIALISYHDLLNMPRL